MLIAWSGTDGNSHLNLGATDGNAITVPNPTLSDTGWSPNVMYTDLYNMLLVWIGTDFRINMWTAHLPPNRFFPVVFDQKHVLSETVPNTLRPDLTCTMLNGMIYVAWQDASSNFQVIYFDSNVSTVKSASPPAGGPGCSKPSIAFNTVNAKDVLWLTWLENQEFMMSQSTDGVNFGTPTNLGIQGKNSELALVPGPDGTYLAWADQNNNIYWKNPAGDRKSVV